MQVTGFEGGVGNPGASLGAEFLIFNFQFSRAMNKVLARDLLRSSCDLL